MNTSPFLTRYQLFLNPATHISVNFAASDYISITIQPVPLPPPSCTPSLTTAIYFTKPTQLNRLQHIQNSLARAVVRAIKSFHINPALKSLHWLKIRQRIDYKILSLTYKVLTNTQPAYLYTCNLISVHPHRSTRSSDVVTLSRQPFYSSLKVNDRSFRRASPCLWNQLPKELRLPTDREEVSLSSDLTREFVISFITTVTIHYSFSLHSRLKTHLFHKSFPL